MAQPHSCWLFWAGLLLSCIVGSPGQPRGNNCTGADSCADCLRAGPSCAWCKDPRLVISARCDEVEALEGQGCNPEDIENPHGSLVLQKHKGISLAGAGRVAERLQGEGPSRPRLRPQEVMLKLRVGKPLTVPLSLQVAGEYPIDLYCLMGPSSTRKGPLEEEARSLVTSLRTMLRNISSDLQIGLGIFGGGAEMPATAPKGDQQSPCPPDPNCSGPLRYRHLLGLTPNETLFEDLLAQQDIFGNGGSSGSGSGAVMQVASCPSRIGWRRTALRLLLVATNAGFHVAAGDVLPNSRGCRLDEGGSLCTCDGHPSVAHLAQLLSDNNIQTIFAVTPDVRPVYEELQSSIPKSTVETLSSDTSNLTRFILDAYWSLSSEVIWESSNQPKEVTVEYQLLCSSQEEMAFEVEVTANQCPEEEPSEALRIQPRGYSEQLVIHLTVICECPCQSERTSSSPWCHGSPLECGACRCLPGQYGKRCECSTGDRGTQDPETTCRAPNSSEVCSGHGECVCGQCVCMKRESPEERYSGQFCECDNFRCARSNGLLCGGHGRCLCGECECQPDYTGSACECPLDTSLCEAPNGQICHGRGTCECGLCHCDVPYHGNTCEMSPPLDDVSAEDNADS